MILCILEIIVKINFTQKLCLTYKIAISVYTISNCVLIEVWILKVHLSTFIWDKSNIMHTNSIILIYMSILVISQMLVNYIMCNSNERIYLHLYLSIKHIPLSTKYNSIVIIASLLI